MTPLDPTMTLLAELIRILPQCSLILLIALVVLLFRRNLVDLLKGVSAFDGFGVKVEFADAKVQLRQAIYSYKNPLSAGGTSALNPARQIPDEILVRIIQRAERSREILKGARILWVDDHPLSNASIFRFLNDYGIIIDTTSDTAEAVGAIKWATSAYELIVTDMVRFDNGTAGLDLISKVRELDPKKPIILFVLNLDKDRDTPVGATLITNDVADLITRILSIIEESQPAKS